MRPRSLFDKHAQSGTLTHDDGFDLGASRILGLKPLALLAAALGVYFAGFMIYGLIFSQAWMDLSGFDGESFEGEGWRMALGPVIALVITLGIGLLIKDRGITTWRTDAKLGAFVGGFFCVVLSSTRSLTALIHLHSMPSTLCI